MRFNVSKVFQEKEPYPHKDIGRRSWRWCLEFDWASISLNQYVKFESEQDWNFLQVPVSYFYVALEKRFKFGSEHFYYDGPHCSFSLGFLRFYWRYWWCKKCMPD